MEDTKAVALACVAILIAIYAVRWYLDPLNAIPTVGGSSLPGLSYVTALRTMRNCKEVLEEGYKKYPESAFKIAMFDRWRVVVSGPNMVEDMRKRPDEELSFSLGSQETLHTKYMIEPQAVWDLYHSNIVKEKFNRKLSAILPDVIDEIAVAVGDYITANGNVWISVEVMPAMKKIIARAINRVLVGLPLCRNEEYLALAVGFTADYGKGNQTLSLVPGFMKYIVAPFIKAVKHDTGRFVSHLRLIVEQRKRALAELGEGWNDKANDMLQLLLDRAASKGEALSSIAQVLLVINFAAITTSSISITQVLYHLAEQPDLLQPLREEIEASIAADGWTATALDNMWKLDSILRETLRYHGLGLLSMNRMALKDITLSDGTRIPKGTLVNAAAYPMHHDTAHLEKADTFDPFRYARMRGVEGSSSESKHQATSTSPEYIPFGHGQHACPGRYFAVHEVKAVLAYIVLHYDLKLGGDGSRPPNVFYAMAVIPAPRGRVLFKKRETSV